MNLDHAKELHVWHTRLDIDDHQHASAWICLSKDERARATRYRFDEHRRHFINARAFLRRVLAHYLNVQPEQIEFEYGLHGKPHLGGDFSGQLAFNLSHAKGHALCAVNRQYAVGIDLEWMARGGQFDSMGIARRYFSTREYQALQQLPKSEQLQGFFNAWSRKEAVVKALGEGLQFPLNQFSVSLKPGEPARLVQINERRIVGPLSLFDWPHVEGFAAAVAVRGEIHTIRQAEL